VCCIFSPKAKIGCREIPFLITVYKIYKTNCESEIHILVFQIGHFGSGQVLTAGTSFPEGVKRLCRLIF